MQPNIRADEPITTQWQDIFDKKAYGKTSLDVYKEVNAMREQAEELARHQVIRKEAVKRLETDGSTSDSLDLSEEDKAFMEDYKAKLVSKLMTTQDDHSKQFTGFKEISVDEYISLTAEGVSVILLHNESVRVSVRTLEMLRRLSERYKRLRIMWIKASDACKGYPKELCPTIIVYSGGKSVHNFVGKEACGGYNTTMEYLEDIIGAYIPLRDYTYAAVHNLQDETEEIIATKLRLDK